MIKEFDVVVINNKEAVVKEILDASQTKFQKAVIILEGQTYSVNLKDLKKVEDK